MADLAFLISSSENVCSYQTTFEENILNFSTTKADSFFAGEAIFANDELGSQSDSFLPATEYFFQLRTTHKPVSYLLPVFRYKYQR